MKSIFCALVFFSLLFVKSYAQTGSLDQDFGVGGKVTTDLLIPYQQINALGLQSDGKIIAVANTTDPPFTASFKVIRYRVNGLIDSSFGVNGIAESPFDGSSNAGYDVIILKDQKIIVAAAVSQGANGFGVIRYLKNGKIDSTFGENGKSFLQIPVSSTVKIRQLNSGKFILASQGYNVSGPEQYFRLTRINSNGSLDTTFGSKGFVSTLLPYTYAYFNALVLESAGDIILGGSITNDFSDFDYLMIRYKASGKIDSSFGNNGIIKDDYSSNSSFIANVITQPNKKILITGTESTDTSAFFALAMYFENGNLDSSFGINGKVITKSFLNLWVSSYASIVDNSGKIILAGNSYDGVTTDFALAKYNINGNLDSSFGIDGKVLTDYQNDYDVAIALTVQNDGKIIAGGLATLAGKRNIALARYNNDIVLPITLSSFTATKKQNSVLLNWQTASETNNNYFAVERSNNSNTYFKEIGRINSKGNSNQLQQYSFEDKLPLNGANYYRLKQVDKDGHATTSKILLVDFSKDAIIKLYPNPVKDILNIEGLTGKKTTLSIIDINGRILASTSVNNASYNWNIKVLPAGNYYLRIEADKKISTIKFVKE